MQATQRVNVKTAKWIDMQTAKWVDVKTASVVCNRHGSVGAERIDVKATQRVNVQTAEWVDVETTQRINVQSAKWIDVQTAFGLSVYLSRSSRHCRNSDADKRKYSFHYNTSNPRSHPGSGKLTRSLYHNAVLLRTWQPIASVCGGKKLPKTGVCC